MVWISAISFMCLVALASYLLTRGKVNDSEGYFLAGRSLTGTFIAGSLLLTNISAEQIIGLAGSAYAFNLSSMAWEVVAVVAIIITALVFLPRFLAHGFTTLPEFLGMRFDHRVRMAVVALFLLAYGLVTIPSVLYSGTIAVVETFTNELNGAAAFPLSMVVIAGIGTLYAITGGLRAVAVSDTLNGVGLIAFGFAVPILGLYHLGAESVLEGWRIVTTAQPEKLNAIGSATDPTPFLTLFTGMLFANLSYWGTNQYVIQRSLAAESLAAGQKGVLLAGFFKLLIPSLIMLPGIIAFHLYGPDIGGMDKAYPRLVRDVLPSYLIGLFLAVLLGTVFSSFNSLLQSSATIITYDIVMPWRGKALSEHEKIKIGRWACLAVSLVGLVVAPSLQLAPEGLWQLIRKFSGFYNIPLIAIVLAALFLPRANSKTALGVVMFHIPVYTVITFFWDSGIHFIHWYGILFVLEFGALALFASSRRHTVSNTSTPVDLTPWRYRWWVVAFLWVCIIGLYLLLSPVGIAA
ncbi:MAG: solute:sodium symporter family transporter [Proteobacteria bacterium]|nr:solute:sodium symporter family transporter [Pseudomonadota bacterium]